jgi:hypothetical protein
VASRSMPTRRSFLSADLPDAVFRELLAANVGTPPDGSLNIERLRLNPLLEDDDSFLALVLSAVIDPATGLIRDPDPAYHLYSANLNWLGPAGNPSRPSRVTVPEGNSIMPTAEAPAACQALTDRRLGGARSAGALAVVPVPATPHVPGLDPCDPSPHAEGTRQDWRAMGRWS